MIGCNLWLKTWLSPDKEEDVCHILRKKNPLHPQVTCTSASQYVHVCSYIETIHSLNYIYHDDTNLHYLNCVMKTYSL